MSCAIRVGARPPGGDAERPAEAQGISWTPVHSRGSLSIRDISNALDINAKLRIHMTCLYEHICVYIYIYIYIYILS